MTYIQEQIQKGADKQEIIATKKLKYLTSRERIVYEDVYDYLVEKNKWDIMLYDYSKTISLVRCDMLNK